jgi:uncharacterized protein YbaA (DUF1428 family)
MSDTQKYVDYFVLPVPKSELTAYEKFGEGMAALAKKHGALDYINTVGDDVKPGKATSFPQAVDLKDGEVVVCSMAIYKSRADRDRANKAIMQDPAMKQLGMPPGAQRLITGGFNVVRGLVG